LSPFIHIMEPTGTDATAAAGDDTPRLSISLHATVMVMQAENGLRHRDYRRYRKYLSRRLQKVRKAAGLSCGRGRVFVKKEITVESVTSTDQLMVLLLNAERSWSYAMELKEASTLEGQHKLKHLAVSRLSRAALSAGQLQTLCQLRTDAQTALEAAAYADWMGGLLLMERESWAEAVSKLSSAKAIYHELSTSGSLHDQDVFLTRLEELDPPIRFCRFNSGTDADMDDDILASSPDLSAKFEEMRAKRVATDISAKSASELCSVQFAGQTIPVLDAEIRTHYTLVKASVDKVSRHFDSNGNGNGSGSGIDATASIGSKAQEKEFSAALGQVDAALDAVSTLASSLSTGAATGTTSRMAGASNAGKVAEMKGSLSLLKNYFTYMRLFLLFMKNKNVCTLLLAGASFVGMEVHSFSGRTGQPFNAEHEAASAQRVHELAHLLDQRLELVKGMLSVPGVAVHDLLKMQLSTEEYVCRTVRACYMAECYVVSRRWAEAVALVDHAEGLASTAEEKYKDFCSAVESTDAGETEEFSTFLAAKAEYSVTVEGLEQLVGGTRARHVAMHALLSSAPAAGSAEEEEGEEGGDNDMDVDRHWSILDRPLQWVEPVSQIDKKNKKAGAKQTLIIDEIPSGFNAIPCKPVFFDIASNYIDFPDLDHRAGLGVKRKARGGTADAAEAEAGASSGIVSNLFGWFSK
jgi:signal recognition particle subunit SRP68